MELVQQMIRKFWQDMLGEKFDDKKKERLEIIFKQTDIFLESEDCDYKGKALNLHNEIYINDNVKKDIMLEIEVLIHVNLMMGGKKQYYMLCKNMEKILVFKVICVF